MLFRRGVYYATTSVSKTAIRTRCSRFIMDKTYIVYKLAFDIKIDNFFEEFMLFMNPLAALLLFFGFALFASKHRNRIIVGISFILSFILFGNAMFYGFYNDFVTFPVLFQTNNMADLGTSIKNSLRIKHYCYSQMRSS